MKRIFTILLCGIFVFGLTGCGSGETESDFKVDNKESDVVISKDTGVTLSVEKDSLTDTGAIFVLRNESDKTYTFVDSWKLEIKQDGKWHKIDVPMNTYTSFELKPGDVKGFEAHWDKSYGELTKGTYRLIKEIDYEKKDKSHETYEIAAEFTID